MRKWVGLILFVVYSAICFAEGGSAGGSVAEGLTESVTDEARDVTESVTDEARDVTESGYRDVRSEGVEHTNVLTIKGGGSYQLDTYLSPLAYTGWQIGIGNEWWQGFRQDTRLGRKGMVADWAHVGRIEADGLIHISSAKSNQTYGLEIHGGWGAFYCWRWFDERLKVFLGPYLEAGFTIRYMNENVNKPLSLDVMADLMAMSGISWSFYGQKTSYRLNYQIRTNLVGFDFVPDYWESYYEISQGVEGVPRCSGHWNHHTIKHELTLDMQFAHSTWRVGVAHDYLNYGTKHMHFIHNEVNLVVGCIWNYRMRANKPL